VVRSREKAVPVVALHVLRHGMQRQCLSCHAWIPIVVVKEKRTLSEATRANLSYALGLPYPRYECCRLRLENISMYAMISSLAS
jgi:hypothetical protein